MARRPYWLLALLLMPVVWLLSQPEPAAGSKHRRGRSGTPDECDSLLTLVIRPQGNTVRLYWYDLPGVSEWAVYRATQLDMSDAVLAAVVRDTNTWLESSTFVSGCERAFYRVTARWDRGSPDNYFVIEDFEDSVQLESYSAGEDREPNAWSLVTDGAYAPYGRSLELSGNTWKRERIDTVRLESGGMWRLAVKLLTRGESEAIGLADSANEMWYAIWGRECRQSEAWNNTYQGWYAADEWVIFDVPVGDDWMGRFGYYPAVTSLLFANDNDGGVVGSFRIDDIRDVTGTISPPPVARFRWQIIGRPTMDSVDIAYCSMGCDPDGPIYRQFWSFGDGTTALANNPAHRYPAHGMYTVALSVEDTVHRLGWAVQQVVDSPYSVTRELTALFVGDVMMARRYEDAGGIIPTQGVNAIFARVQPLLSSVNLAACNLECPLTTATTHHPTKSIYFKGRPEYVGGLQFAGFDLCALANNHAFDYMEEGMYQTKHVLDSVHILNTGADADDELARQPVFYSQNGLCVALLSFCNRDGSPDNEQPFMAAGPSRPGFAMWDRPNMELTIPQARQLADLLVVEVHSGIEYATIPPALAKLGYQKGDEEAAFFQLLPDTSDVELRRYAIELGADLLINHHPHVIQGIEIYQGKLIAHSMGNFAFDQQLPETFVSMAIKARLSAADGVTNFVVRPIYVDRYIPTPATGELAGALLDYESELSRPMGTWIVRGATADSALVLMDTSYLRFGSDYQDTLALEDRGDHAISAPFRLEGVGYPVRVTAMLPANAEARIGREVFWIGNMENEGSTLWNLNSNYERYDTTMYLRGHRSIRLNRAGGGTNDVRSDLLYRPPYDGSHDYSVIGWIRGQLANNASIIFDFCQGRSGNPLSSQTIQTELDGTFNWTRVWDDLDPPDETYCYNIKVYAHAPTDPFTEGVAWFDDVNIIRWESWRTGQTLLGFPNNVTYVQVRAPLGTSSAVISYRRELVSLTGNVPGDTYERTE